MTTFKKGGKVRLVSDCFKRPEFKVLERWQRKEISKLASRSGKITSSCYASDNWHVWDDENLINICIPAALLEPAEPTKTHQQAVQAIAGAVERFKPKLRPDVGEWIVFDSAFMAGSPPCVDATKTYKVIAHDKLHWAAFYIASDLHPGGTGACADRPIKPPFFFVGSLDKYRIVPAPKRVYTPEQIAEARDVSYRIMATRDCLTAVYIQPVPTHFLDITDKPNKDKPHTVARELSTEQCERGHYKEVGRAVSFCSPDDEWNDDIGIMVALCKLTGTKLPNWINGGTR